VVNVRDFPLIWSKIAELLLSEKLQESPQNPGKPFSHFRKSRVGASFFAYPIEVDTTVLDLDHPVTGLVLYPQPAGRVLRELNL
jgi:hypothetical protein